MFYPFHGNNKSQAHIPATRDRAGGFGMYALIQQDKKQRLIINWLIRQANMLQSAAVAGLFSLLRTSYWPAISLACLAYPSC
ncbi:hypothetical protein [Aquitalea sp.]|uniref:hypothetical protein n=1 Tax=Aquitalea sp. TaxID=1872623 RepID=UPI00258ECE74|nr:hypothetical protein [Aquitalea sp.]